MNKLPIKIMFVDIDWTIFDHTIKDFDHVSIATLKQAQKNGILVYISTARPYFSAEKLGIFKYFTPDGIITSNGGVVYYKDKIIYGKPIPKNVVNNVCKEATKHHMNVEIIGTKSRYIINNYLKDVKKLYELFYDVEPFINRNIEDNVYVMTLIGNPKYDSKIIPLFTKDMFYFRFNDLGMDISCSPTEKGNAIEFIYKYHNINEDNALSIGDSELDLSMFEKTKYSIAVGNALPKVKEKATHVCDSVMEHGISKILPDLLDI